MLPTRFGWKVIYIYIYENDALVLKKEEMAELKRKK